MPPKRGKIGDTDVTIYLLTGDQECSVQFSLNDDDEAILSLFRTAAEAGPDDIIKLVNLSGEYLNISNRLLPNSSFTRYHVEVMAAVPWKVAGKHVVPSLGSHVSRINAMLVQAEESWFRMNSETPECLIPVTALTDQMVEKLFNVSHLSWLGLYKGQRSLGYRQYLTWPNVKPTSDREERYKEVFKKYEAFSGVRLTREMRDFLKRPKFDSWQWADHEMLLLLKHMFVELNLHTTFNFDLATLDRFLKEVYKNYLDVPFHNFRHAFAVAQMAYCLIWMLDLKTLVGDFDILVLFVSAISQDLGHTGYNNAYQINAKTELARRYNDASPLENHHLATLFDILHHYDKNIVKNLTQEQFRRFRESVIICILATDLSKHNAIISEFKEMIPVFDIKIKEHKNRLLTVLLKVADISNEARPMDVSLKWRECLLAEFDRQFTREAKEFQSTIPVREAATARKPSAQVGFLEYVLIPMYEALAELMPQVKTELLVQVKRCLEYWQEMDKLSEMSEARHRQVLEQTFHWEMPRSASKIIYSAL